MPPPRHGLARLVESGLPQARVVAALVDVHADPFRLAVAHTRWCHALARQLLGRSGVKAAQLLGAPAIAPIGPYRPGGVKIPRESHLTRHPIEVKDMHAAPQPVLDAIAAGVAHHQRPRPRLRVGGQAQRRRRTAQSRDRPWAPRARVPWEVHRLLQVPETVLTAVRRGEHRLAPWAGWERAPAAPDGGATPPDGAPPDAAVVQRRQLGRGHDLGIPGPPLGMDAGALLPQRDKLERRTRLGTPGERRLGLAEDPALVRVRADAHHPGPGVATPGPGVLVQPGGIAPTRARGQVQGAGGGVRTQHRRSGADPAREPLVLMGASGARGGGGGGGCLRGPMEARQPANRCVAVQVVAVAAPCFVQQLQDEQAPQRTGRGHQRGARRAGVADQGRAAHTGQPGQAEQHPRNARAQATSWRTAQRARSGDARRRRDGWGRGLRRALGAPEGGLPTKGGTSPACTWARTRQTRERHEVSREPHCWAIAGRRRPSMQQARSASYWRCEVATGASKPPRQPVSSMSQTSVRVIDFPRVAGSPRAVNAQKPQEPQADQTTADAVGEARHRRRRVAQNPFLHDPLRTRNRSTLPSQVSPLSG